MDRRSWCFCCGISSEPETYCEVCGNRFCLDGPCRELHADIHRRVLQERRLDEITSDLREWNKAVARMMRWRRIPRDL